MLTPGGVNQGELVQFLQALRNRGFSDPDLAQASTTTQVKTTNTFQYMVDGILKSKAATDNQTIAALTATAAGETCRVRVEINAAGTITFKQGPIGAGITTAPVRSPSKATIGYFDMPASFTPGTSLTSLVTFYDGDPDLGLVDLSPVNPSLEA